MQGMLPNAISALRFPLALAFALADGFGARIAIVVLAAASDWVDGRLARAAHQVSRTGEVLDPIADKTFMLAALLTLALEGTIAFWTLPLLLARDIGVAIGAGVLLARGLRVRMPARRPGKIVTWLQFGCVGLMLLWPPTAPWVAWAVGSAGVLALIDYGRAARERLRHSAQQRDVQEGDEQG